MRSIAVGIDAVTDLKCSPDGTQLVVAGHARLAIGAWPIGGGRSTPFVISRSQDKVAEIAWHPDGHLFVAAGLDGVVQVRDARLRVRRELVGLPSQQGPVVALSFSPKGDLLALGGGWWGEETSVIVVQTATWRRLLSLQMHTNQIGTVHFLNDALILSGSADRSIRVGNLQRPDGIATVAELPSPIQAIEHQPNGNRLAVAAGNAIHLGQIVGETVRLREEGATCLGHKRAVKAIDISPDGRSMVSAGEDGTLRFWHTDSGASVASLNLELGDLHTVAFSPDGLTVVAGGDEGTLAIVDVNQ